MFLYKDHIICNICSNETCNFKKCIKCKNANVCDDCIINLCEQGNCMRCPFCRQTEWRSVEVSKHKVAPHDVKMNVTIKNKEVKYDLCVIFLNVSFYIVASWLFGFLTILLICPFILHFDYVIIWVPLLIGIFELSIGIFCCLGKAFNINLCEKEENNCKLLRIF